MNRYFLKLAYNGEQYCGWQIQREVPTVQQTILNTLKIFLKDVESLVGCGRTDSGVHATEFYAHFDTACSIPDELVYRLNAILPKDIAIHQLFPVGEKDHARFSAEERQYKYYVHYSKDPFKNGLSALSVVKYNIELMNKACEIMMQYEDFTSFSRLNTQTKTNICYLKEAYWEETANGLVFSVSANRFLRNMVRAIVGTMFLVGEKKIDLQEFRQVIESKDRQKAGKSAYACGLYLNRVKYPFIK